MSIFIHYTENTHLLPDEKKLIPYLEWLITNEHFVPGEINLIFTDNPEILRLNRKYLNHDYYTDVITFYYENPEELDGDIFISLDKVFENSRDYQTEFTQELLRVIFHGFLHLAGYDDQSDNELALMREKEEYYLTNYYLEKK
ncbi:MAG: rRNA maturation RNase YbeY [Bacteroidota bacterium]